SSGDGQEREAPGEPCRWPGAHGRNRPGSSALACLRGRSPRRSSVTGLGPRSAPRSLTSSAIAAQSSDAPSRSRPLLGVGLYQPVLVEEGVEVLPVQLRLPRGLGHVALGSAEEPGQILALELADQVLLALLEGARVAGGEEIPSGRHVAGELPEQR